MTNKTYRFAAVAAVLLILLVFVAPVSAADVTLTVADAGSSSSPTTFYVNGDESTSYNLNVILRNSTENYDEPSGSLLNDGDRVLLPGGVINVTSSHEQYRIYGNITIEGAADGSTVFNVHSTKNYRVFQIYSRYDLQTEANVVLKNFTVEGNNGKDKANANNRHGIVLTSYLIDLQVENVIFKNLTGHVFSAWAQQSLNDNSYPTVDDNVGVDITLKNVVTENNGALIHFDVAPYSSGAEAEPAYGFVHLNYDETSTFNDKTDGNLIYSEDGLDEITYNYKPACILFQGNMRINDNMDITLGSAVAKIGENYYGSLQEAVDAASAGQTVTLLKDVTTSLPITVDKSIILDGNDKTITRNPGNAAIYLKNETEDVTLAVTLQNFKEIAGKYAVYIGSKTNLEVKDSTLNGWGAIYFANYAAANDDADGSTVLVSKSTLIGTNTYSTPAPAQNDFATIVFESGNSTATITDSTVKAIAKGTNNQSIVTFSGWYGPNSNDVVTFTGGELILDKGTSSSVFVYTAADAQHDSVVIGEGVYANFNPSAYIASGMEVVQPGDKYLVQKYVDRSSSSSSSSSSSTEEPEQPEEPVVEPETPVEEPVAGEVTVETEVTDGGEVFFETQPEEGSEPVADAPVEISAVVLPEGTAGEVAFVPVSEQPAPAGKETQTKKVFEINVPTYEKGNAATVKFTMTVAELAADGKTAAEVALWHFDEETGEWTKLVTSYTIVDGVVYFEAITYDFSPFAIIYEDAVEQPEQPVEEPETPASPAPVLGVLAALGAAVVLRRK